MPGTFPGTDGQVPTRLAADSGGWVWDWAKLRETGGPTTLAVGAIADGQLLKRTGANVVGQAQGTGGGLDADTVDGKHAADLLSPVGVVVPYAGRTAPTGWLLCDGAAVSRTTYGDLFGVLSFERSGTLTSGSAVVTGLSQTSDLRVGMALTGTGIPAGTTINSIDSGSQITMSANATATGTQTIRFYIYGAGDGSTTFNVPDLRGRTPIGAGQGSGLSQRALGALGGAETHVLTMSEMPSHTHPIDTRTTGAGGSLANLMQSANATNSTLNTSATGGGGAHNNMPPFGVMNYIIKS